MTISIDQLSKGRLTQLALIAVLCKVLCTNWPVDVGEQRTSGAFLHVCARMALSGRAVLYSKAEDNACGKRNLRHCYSYLSLSSWRLLQLRKVNATWFS